MCLVCHKCSVFSIALQEYFSHLKPEIAVSSLAEGKEFYQQCLNYHLSCSMTPEEIHDIGLKEVERIKIEIERVCKHYFGMLLL